jgi:hypothetical protein
MEENTIERSPEMIPTRTEIMDVIHHFAEHFTLISEKSDERGTYFLEVKVEGSEPGEYVQYEYTRKGRFPDGHMSTSTVIQRVFYTDDIPQPGSDNLADYDNETGEWKEFNKLVRARHK